MDDFVAGRVEIEWCPKYVELCQTFVCSVVQAVERESPSHSEMCRGRLVFYKFKQRILAQSFNFCWMNKNIKQDQITSIKTEQFPALQGNSNANLNRIRASKWKQ